MAILHKLGQLHWAEYAAEGLGTGLLVFVGLSAVVFNFGKGLLMEQWIPNVSLRLLLNGLLFSGTGSLIAISPLGKLSGAHINPSLSLAFWLQGKMHRQDFMGYVIAQCLGAITGAFLLVRLWGSYAASVDNGMTLPGANYSLGMVFFAEVSMTFLLVLLIFGFVSSHRLLRWTPLITWIVVAGMVWLESPISGTSLNLARSLGPALLSERWNAQWIYAIAPFVGAAIAVAVFRFLERDVLTGKLFHVPHYRSIFKNVKAPCLKNGCLAH
jgi:aquaporin Z